MTKFGFQVTTCLIMINCVMRLGNMLPVSTKFQGNVKERFNDHKGLPEIDTTTTGGVSKARPFDTIALGGVSDVTQNGEFTRSQGENTQNYKNVNANQNNPNSTDPTRVNSVKEEINMEVVNLRTTIADRRKRANSTSSVDVLFSTSDIMEDSDKPNYKMDDLFILLSTATERIPNSNATTSQGSTFPHTLSIGSSMVSNASFYGNISKNTVTECLRQASDIIRETKDVFDETVKKEGSLSNMEEVLEASTYDPKELDLVIRELQTSCQNIPKALAALNDTMFRQDDNINILGGNIRNNFCSLRINVRKLVNPNSSGGCRNKHMNPDLGDKAEALAVLWKISQQTKTIFEIIQKCIKE